MASYDSAHAASATGLPPSRAHRSSAKAQRRCGAAVGAASAGVAGGDYRCRVASEAARCEEGDTVGHNGRGCRGSLSRTQAGRCWKSGRALAGRGGWSLVGGLLVYSRHALVALQGDEQQRVGRIESRRFRKVALHALLVAQHEAAISAAAAGERLRDCIETEVLGAVRVTASGVLARVGRLERALEHADGSRATWCSSSGRPRLLGSQGSSVRRSSAAANYCGMASGGKSSQLAPSAR